MYHDGEGIQQSDAEFIKWCRRAAEQGMADAQESLGRAYLNGHNGVEEDVYEAVKWIRMAAGQNSATAQYLLGVVNFGSQRPIIAYAWMSIAADNGDPDAIEFMQVFDYDLTPEQIEEGKALADRLRPSADPGQ
jgi:TPR repeat protein